MCNGVDIKIPAVPIKNYKGNVSDTILFPSEHQLTMAVAQDTRLSRIH